MVISTYLWWIEFNLLSPNTKTCTSLTERALAWKLRSGFCPGFDDASLSPSQGHGLSRVLFLISKMRGFKEKSMLPLCFNVQYPLNYYVLQIFSLKYTNCLRWENNAVKEFILKANALTNTVTLRMERKLELILKSIPSPTFLFCITLPWTSPLSKSYPTGLLRPIGSHWLVI